MLSSFTRYYLSGNVLLHKLIYMKKSLSIFNIKLVSIKKTFLIITIIYVDLESISVIDSN